MKLIINSCYASEEETFYEREENLRIRLDSIPYHPMLNSIVVNINENISTSETRCACQCNITPCVVGAIVAITFFVSTLSFAYLEVHSK